MSIKYTIIIPVYNAAKTISRCLDSLLCQIRDDCEIILINDGSIDESGIICRNYSKHYSQIQLFEKTNGGVSSARNLGIENAKGKYITFVDSDDYVNVDYISKIDEGLSIDDDFLMFGKSVYNGENIQEYPLFNKHTENLEETSKLLCESLVNQQLNSPVNKVFTKEIIEQNELRFREDLFIGEDKVFVIQYLMHVKSARFMEFPLYIVSTENEASLSRKKREDLCEQILKEHDLLFKTIEESTLPQCMKKNYLGAISFSYYRSAYTVIKELKKFDLSDIEKHKKVYKICELYAKRKVCRWYNTKNWLISLPIRIKTVRILSSLLLK